MRLDHLLSKEKENVKSDFIVYLSVYYLYIDTSRAEWEKTKITYGLIAQMVRAHA